MRMGKLVAAAVAIGLTGFACGSCLTDDEARRFVEHFFSRTAAPDLPAMSEAEAQCSRAKVNGLMQRRHGPVVGYKVGLTHAIIRNAVKGDKPIWGVLYQGMILPNGSRVPPAFGARPTVEADLLVRVSSEAINSARTPMEVMQAIDQVIPFIELPDMMVNSPYKLDARTLMAINAGARLGVAGTPIPVPADAPAQQALLDALRDMRLVMSDGARVIGHARGSDLMGHPLHAVVWLAEALGKEGLAMKPGQLISLGSFPPVIPMPRGLSFVVTYAGLPGAEPVSVQFGE